MIGCSIFLGNGLSDFERAYLLKMKELGAKRIFTSLHIPEEQSGDILTNLKELSEFASNLGLSLMVDVSRNALTNLGLSGERLQKLQEWGVMGVRLDDGFTLKEIAAYSHRMKIGLNASTLTQEDLQLLKEENACFSHLEAWHNYYPRPETGLAGDWLYKKNQQLKEAELKIVAFISGNKMRRGPLHAGLPTLEKHREQGPLVSYLELKEDYLVDEVFIGDPSLTERSLDQFQAYFSAEKILLHVSQVETSQSSVVLREHQQRPDVARDVIRADGSRSYTTATLKPLNCVERSRGSVTLDNQLYGRYQGELQIVKSNLPADPKVNVVARVVEEEWDLLMRIGAKQCFELVKERKKK